MISIGFVFSGTFEFAGAPPVTETTTITTAEIRLAAFSRNSSAHLKILIFHCQQLGLLMGGGDDSIDGFVSGSIGAVLEYDRRRGTVLGQTLESYFAAGGSPARAAELLHVHVNTVTQRLERLSTLLGEDWQRPDRGLEIQLALRLHRLRA